MIFILRNNIRADYEAIKDRGRDLSIQAQFRKKLVSMGHEKYCFT